MEETNPNNRFFAVISLKEQKVISEYETQDDATRAGIDLIGDLREAGNEEEASNIRVLHAFDLSHEELAKFRIDPTKAILVALISHPIQRKIYCLDPIRFIPEKHDPRVIPCGMYCYSWEVDPNPPPKKDENDITHGLRVKRCFYFERKTFNGVQISWCNYLGKGGENLYSKSGQSHEDFSSEGARLLEYFGSQEALNKALPLDMISDCVKCCGVP
jgi:hypothetical protein